RFSKGRAGTGNDLAGHSFGNLFITAMAAITGSFEQAVAESGKVLAIRGQILPSTLQDVTLYADVAAETGSEQVKGESAIPHSAHPIERVYLKPDTPPAYPGALRAILDADLIVLGPGSLFTSLLPNLLVPELAQAIRAGRAPKLYIANVATQPGETEQFTLADHIRALEAHVGPGLFSRVVANNNLTLPLPAEPPVNLVNPTLADKMRYELVPGDIISANTPWRHDPDKLAGHIIAWFQSTAQKQVEFE
ncbi:MAG: uridine diphosphate-N-acetylglucosamine-binding protein YvcK, partial [Anaerolineae bacterium]